MDSISQIGNLHEAKINEVIPSQSRFAYRNKMEFSFCDRRWLLPEEMERKSSEGEFALGLHVPGTFYKVIDVENCLLQHDTGNRLLRAVKQYAKNSGLPAYGLKTHKGFWRFLSLRYSVSDDEWMVNIVTSENRPEIVNPLVSHLERNFNKIGTIVNNITSRKASISTGEKEFVLTGKGFINDKIGDFRFQISSNSFFQTNTPAAQNLFETVSRFAGLTGAESVLDLYSGTGTIPIFLSKMAKNISGIEISESAVMDARKNCEQNNVSNCHFICGDMREALTRIEKRPDLIIVDPPRAGMHKDVLSRVLEMKPERIVYVSCNPTTMARDISLMAPEYALSEIQPVDMFPHTYHIESVSKLHRRKL
jgi:23S rRNA (uracil1939-C5)-methyltransferase